MSPALGTTSRLERLKKRVLQVAGCLEKPLDRVKTLGSERSGHTGCVNALSWAWDGELLFSGGDDTIVRIWHMNPSNPDPSADYPYVNRNAIHTGHQQNIFNVQLLPSSSRMATVARDAQIRVFDLSQALDYTHWRKNITDPPTAVLCCHKSSVKRIVTEHSPDLFLTVSEDGTVRQHDLRVHHTCPDACEKPLVELPFGLSSLSLSPLTPYQFVVAGCSPHGYLFDRRFVGRLLQREWGVPPDPKSPTTCVRRFGRRLRTLGQLDRNVHITGTRMSAHSGHEVLLSYSADAVYMYSTYDNSNANDSFSRKAGHVTSSEHDTSFTEKGSIPISGSSSDVEIMDVEEADSSSVAVTESPADIDTMDQADGPEWSDDEGSEEILPEHVDPHDNIPIVLPRVRYSGACNVETVKDVNFLGAGDEYVASGSDDGNFFIWRKHTGKLHGIYEGDGSTVNVIEQHPHFPIIAVSGIDTTVKLFAPVHGESKSSRTANATAIMERNAQASLQDMRQQYELAALYRHYLRTASRYRALNNPAPGEPPTDLVPQCPSQ